MAETVKAAVIGCGTISGSHIESYQTGDGVEVVCLCDIDSERAAEQAEKFQIGRIDTDYKNVLSDDSIDCVSVCTDHRSHAEIIIDALRAGKHVLVEKPVCMTTELLADICAEAEKHPNLVCSGIFQHRFDSAIRYVKKLLEDGAFGKVLTASAHIRCNRGDHYYAERDWRGTWEFEGGSVCINQAIHNIDSLVWLMGGVKTVCGAWANRDHEGVIETEDTAVASLQFKNGALGTIEATSASNIPWENTLLIHGTKGSLELREGQGIKIKFSDDEIQAKAEDDLQRCHDTAIITSGKRYYGRSHPSQIQDFVDAIREKRAPFVPVSSARHTVEVVLAIYRSGNTGTRQEL